MAQKDIISKQTIKRIAIDIAIYLLKLDINPDEVELLPTEQQRVEERRADLVVKLKTKDDKAFILHVEIQNNNDKSMPLRMMRYYTDIAFAYPDLTIKQYVIYIGQKPLSIKAVINNDNWQYHYHLIDLHKIDCQELIERDNPDALILAVLCDFKGQEKQAIINHIVLRLHELLADDSKTFREYLSMLDVLAGNRNLQKHIQKATEMITQIEIEKTGLYQLGEQRGEKRGEQQGKQWGEISTLQNSIITILKTRFQSIPDALAKRLLSTEQTQLLNTLLIKAISISKASELFED